MTLACAVLDYASALEEAAGSDPELALERARIARDLRTLVRELADTEDPDPTGDPAELPSMRHPSDLPTDIEEVRG